MERILKYIDENYYSKITKGEIEELVCELDENSFMHKHFWKRLRKIRNETNDSG